MCSMASTCLIGDGHVASHDLASHDLAIPTIGMTIGSWSLTIAILGTLNRSVASTMVPQCAIPNGQTELVKASVRRGSRNSDRYHWYRRTRQGYGTFQYGAVLHYVTGREHAAWT